MRVNGFWFSLLLFAGHYSMASEAIHAITQNIRANDVILIGEKHKKPESIQLFKSLVVKQIEKKQCVVIALIVESNQQPIIDKILLGRTKVGNLKVSDVMDHEEYRDMIRYFAQIKNEGACLSIIAIDAGSEIPETRNQWMVKQLRRYAGRLPVFVLVGNLHTLKIVNWDLSQVGKPQPNLAKSLLMDGFRVKSFPQVWLTESCESYVADVTSEPDEIVTSVNEHLITLLNAFAFQSTAKVVDGVIVWKCSN